jgi:hypothetical protein
MGVTGWIASAALSISLASLVSNLTLAWLRWPRIVVEVAARHDGESCDAASDRRVTHSAGDVFILMVINNGSEPVTVKSIGLTRRGRAAHRLDYLHTWRGPATDRLPIAHGAGDELTMPVRIAGHGAHVFEYTHSALQDMPLGVHYHGYAQRYLAFRWLPNRPILRETRSKQTVIRSSSKISLATRDSETPTASDQS